MRRGNILGGGYLCCGLPRSSPGVRLSVSFTDPGSSALRGHSLSW